MFLFRVSNPSIYKLRHRFHCNYSSSSSSSTTSSSTSTTSSSSVSIISNLPLLGCGERFVFLVF